MGQRLLCALNSFFTYFEKLGFRVKVHGPRTQAMSVDMDGRYYYFRFVCFDDGNHFYRRKNAPGKAYGFSWTSDQDRMSENKDYREYVDITPEILRDLAIELLMNIEERKRDHVHWLHQRQVDKKNDAISKIAERKAKATLRRRKETKRLIEMRIQNVESQMKEHPSAPHTPQSETDKRRCHVRARSGDRGSAEDGCASMYRHRRRGV